MIAANSGFILLLASPYAHQRKAQSRTAFGVVLSKKRDQVCCLDSRETDSISYQARNRRCECFDFHKELVPYQKAWSWQKSLVKMRQVLVDKDEDQADMLIILQHPPVYTLGTGSSGMYLKFDVQNPPYEIYRTERGGEVTFHGPGQIVMYPIINLRYHKMDLNWYLRSLEEVVIRVLTSTFCINASRIEGLTGIWVENQKVAAIGIRASRWITYHGLALNVTTDLTPFQQIVPCGIRDCQVGSLHGLLEQTSGMKTEDAELLDIAYYSLRKEFAEVFQLSLETPSASNLNLLDESFSLLTAN